MTTSHLSTGTITNLTRVELEQLRKADFFAGGKALTTGDDGNVVGVGNILTEAFSTGPVLSGADINPIPPPANPGSVLQYLSQVAIPSSQFPTTRSETVKWYGPTLQDSGIGYATSATAFTVTSPALTSSQAGDILLIKPTNGTTYNANAVGIISSVTSGGTVINLSFVNNPTNDPSSTQLKSGVFSQNFSVIRPSAVKLLALPNSGSATGYEQAFLMVDPDYVDSLQSSSPNTATINQRRITNMVPSTAGVGDRADAVYRYNASKWQTLEQVGYRIILFPDDGTGAPDLTRPIDTASPLINSGGAFANDQRVTIDYKAGIVRLSCEASATGSDFRPTGATLSGIQNKLASSGVDTTTGRMNLYAVFWAFDTSWTSRSADSLYHVISDDLGAALPANITYNSGYNSWYVTPNIYSDPYAGSHYNLTGTDLLFTGGHLNQLLDYVNDVYGIATSSTTLIPLLNDPGFALVNPELSEIQLAPAISQVSNWIFSPSTLSDGWFVESYTGSSGGFTGSGSEQMRLTYTPAATPANFSITQYVYQTVVPGQQLTSRIKFLRTNACLNVASLQVTLTYQLANGSYQTQTVSLLDDVSTYSLAVTDSNAQDLTFHTTVPSGAGTYPVVITAISFESTGTPNYYSSPPPPSVTAIEVYGFQIYATPSSSTAVNRGGFHTNAGNIFSSILLTPLDGTRVGFSSPAIYAPTRNKVVFGRADQTGNQIIFDYSATLDTQTAVQFPGPGQILGDGTFVFGDVRANFIRGPLGLAEGETVVTAAAKSSSSGIYSLATTTVGGQIQEVLNTLDTLSTPILEDPDFSSFTSTTTVGLRNLQYSSSWGVTPNPSSDEWVAVSSQSLGLFAPGVRKMMLAYRPAATTAKSYTISQYPYYTVAETQTLAFTMKYVRTTAASSGTLQVVLYFRDETNAQNSVSSGTISLNTTDSSIQNFSFNFTVPTGAVKLEAIFINLSATYGSTGVVGFAITDLVLKATPLSNTIAHQRERSNFRKIRIFDTTGYSNQNPVIFADSSNSIYIGRTDPAVNGISLYLGNDSTQNPNITTSAQTMTLTAAGSSNGVFMDVKGTRRIGYGITGATARDRQVLTSDVSNPRTLLVQTETYSTPSVAGLRLYAQQPQNSTPYYTNLEIAQGITWDNSTKLWSIELGANNPALLSQWKTWRTDSLSTSSGVIQHQLLLPSSNSTATSQNPCRLYPAINYSTSGYFDGSAVFHDLNTGGGSGIHYLNGPADATPIYGDSLKGDFLYVQSGAHKGSLYRIISVTDTTLTLSTTVASESSIRYQIIPDSSRSFIPAPVSQARNITVVSSGTDYFIQPTDDIILVDTSSARTIWLPPILTHYQGKVLTIKDKSGLASTGNITIQITNSKTVDATSGTLTLTDPYSHINIVTDGSNWYIV